MLPIIAVLVATTAIVLLVKLRARSTSAGLGWMSERWLAEYRASHPS